MRHCLNVDETRNDSINIGCCKASSKSFKAPYTKDVVDSVGLEKQEDFRSQERVGNKAGGNIGSYRSDSLRPVSVKIFAPPGATEDL